MKILRWKIKKHHDVGILVRNNLTDFDITLALDYHTFVDVVRYRVHILQQSLLQQEQVEMNRIFFQCPKCLQNYSELQAQRLLSKDFKFICSNCSPNDDLRATMSEPYFTLIEQDNKSKLHDVLNLDRKMKEQFHESLNDSATTGIPRCNHLGIFELLSLLKDKTLIRNKPSENIKRGLFTSRITDSATLLEIEENSKVMRGRALKESSQRADGKDKDGSLIVELVSDLDERSPTVKDAVHDKGGGGDRGGGGESSLPTFLRGSRIAGARNEDVVESNVLIASEKKRTFSELGASALSTASKVESEFFSAFGNSGNVSNGSTVMSMPVPARTSSEVIRELNDENIEWENED